MPGTTVTTAEAHHVEVISDFQLGSFDPVAAVMLVLTKQVEHPAEIVVSVVDEVQSAALNACYRERAGATNVLSFPDKVAVEGGRTLLGDIVVCYPVAAGEAVEQGKPLGAHLTHLLVHGVLHLLGYDHGDEPTATHMEGLEVQLLAQLGLPDPYCAQGLNDD